MAHVVQEKRQYQRILPSKESIQTLEEKGFEWVFSSNVSAIAVRGKDLIIRFHNGSIYSYAGQGRNYERLMAAASKGKWVWRFLIRPGVSYAKIGSLPLPEDTTETDEEIVQTRIPTHEIVAVVPTEEERWKGALPTFEIREIEGQDLPSATGIVTREVNTQPLTIEQMQENITQQLREIEEPEPIIPLVKKTESIYLQNEKEIDKLQDEGHNLKKFVKESNYDGKPMVVKNRKEFENLAAKKPIIAYRGYTSRKKEEADKYRKEMESGEFYLGGTGGSLYGQGVYTAYGKQGNKPSLFAAQYEAKDYAKYDDKNYHSKVDTMLFADDFKEINKEVIGSTFQKKVFEIIENDLTPEEQAKAIEYLDECIKVDEVGIEDHDATWEEKMNVFNNRQESYKRVSELAKALPPKAKEAIGKVSEKAYYFDDSVKAIMMGYDGINVSKVNYMIVLNRSKLILLGDDGDV